MASLQRQLAALVGTGIIVWTNHPEMKSFNGILTEADSEHLSLVVDGNTYWIPYNAITGVRSI